MYTKQTINVVQKINRMANLEGWGIFWAIDKIEEWRIEKLDEESKFIDDDDAIRHIVNEAAKGSQLHIDTIKFICNFGNPSENLKGFCSSL